MMLFDRLPMHPVALPADELALLAALHGSDWPDNAELSDAQHAAARRLERRGLIKISRQKMDHVAVWPTWFAGLLPSAFIRAVEPPG